MQIFVVEPQPVDISHSLCDRHINSEINQVAEMLAIAHIRNNEYVPPMHRLKATAKHLNAPCAKWVSETEGNYNWTLRFGIALCAEHKYRYNKEHIYQADILRMYYPPFALLNANEPGTPHAIVVPVKCRVRNEPLLSYRNYYHHKAASMNMRWTKRLSPPWFIANEFLAGHA